MIDCVIIGGGAAGVFAAIQAKSTRPEARVVLLEKTAVLLAKVKISGGGRCNVTHSCFEPKQLVQNYPRGGKELLGPFHKFQPRDTISWFEARGVSLKTEKDGRIFPTTDSSETIIQTLLGEAKRLGVEIWQRKKVESIEHGFTIHLKDEEPLRCSRLILATGSSPKGHEWARHLGHKITETLPSLFTFNVPTSPLKNLSGLSVSDCNLKIAGTPFEQRGPLLLTHFGFSGPAAIKLSAWAAPSLFERKYRATLIINWVPSLNADEIFVSLEKEGANNNPFHLPKNLWKALAGNPLPQSKKALRKLAEKLSRDPYEVDGKTTNKEEFVTCGGVALKEVDFQSMGSKVCKGLYFAGEILNIDGITGGFNFQNAWTTAFLAGRAAVL